MRGCILWAGLRIHRYITPLQTSTENDFHSAHRRLSLLEAAPSGVSVAPAYAPLFPLLVANDDAVLDLLPNPENEHEYVERVDRLVQKPEERCGAWRALRKRLLIDHVGQGWLHRLAALYQKTDCLTHSPRPIPASTSMTDADISLTRGM